MTTAPLLFSASTWATGTGLREPRGSVRAAAGRVDGFSSLSCRESFINRDDRRQSSGGSAARRAAARAGPRAGLRVPEEGPRGEEEQIQTGEATRGLESDRHIHLFYIITGRPSAGNNNSNNNN